jgi:hypothetical protein
VFSVDPTEAPIDCWDSDNVICSRQLRASELVSWGGVRLSPLGMSATNCPIVPSPDDRWVWSSRWNKNWQGKPKYSEKTCSNAILSTTNPTWPDLGSNLGRRGRNTSLCTYALSHARMWRYNSTILDLGTRWSWVVRFTSLPLNIRYQLNMRLSRPQSRPGRCGKEKKSLTYAENRFPLA